MVGQGSGFLARGGRAHAQDVEKACFEVVQEIEMTVEEPIIANGEAAAGAVIVSDVRIPEPKSAACV